MKANQKHLKTFLDEEEAVSPVIAVILMVAITVVLAATVFVLVSDLGGDVGKTGPKLSLVSDSTTSTSKWTVKISDATQSANLADFQFVLSTPSNGTIVVDPSETSFMSPAAQHNATSSASSSSRTAASDTTIAATTTQWRFTFTDISGDGKFNTLDTVQVVYDTSDGDTSANTIPTGSYKLEIRHKPTNTATGSVEQGF